MIYQKATQNAIAAMSRLAEVHSGETTPQLSAKDIAASRNLSVPMVGKILTELSRGGLVTGSPGPGGGYRLARAPAEISLKEVVELFQRESDQMCPFGPGWCGNQEPCPLHDSLMAMNTIIDDYLKRTTFAVFRIQLAD